MTPYNANGQVLQSLQNPHSMTICITPVDELVSSKVKMIGVGKKNSNVLNFLNYKA